MGRLGRMKTVIQYELQICGSINLNAPNKAVVASLDAAFPSSPTNLKCTSGEGEEEAGSRGFRLPKTQKLLVVAYSTNIQATKNICTV